MSEDLDSSAHQPEPELAAVECDDQAMAEAAAAIERAELRHEAFDSKDW